MIPNTLAYSIFIRITIFCLRAITPLSILCCVCYLVGARFLPLPLAVLTLAEAAFYLLVSLPRQYVLDISTPRIKTRSRQERRELFKRCWASIPDMEAFLSIWFKGHSVDSLCREDVKDFLAWGFLYKTDVTAADQEELEEYLTVTENILGRNLVVGRGPCKPSRVSTDPLSFQHKSLLFYIIGVGGDDIMTYTAMKRIAFEHHRLTLYNSLSVFPFRPHTLFSENVSPAHHLSYWHRKHTAPDRLPILFLHGVGAGLRTYTGYFKNFIEHDTNADCQTGIIALEIMPISMRMTTASLHQEDMVREILSILDLHRWEKFVVVAHSYGSIILTHLLRCLNTKNRIGPILLIDPVTLSIHHGDIPHNFIYRKPRKASEWQLQYFASTDIGIAHTITRCFDWSENVLWKDEIRGRTMTIVLSGNDIIVDTVGLRNYLMMDGELGAREYQAGGYKVGYYSARRRGVNILWFDEPNHGEIFDSERDTEIVVDVTHHYCKI